MSISSSEQGLPEKMSVSSSENIHSQPLLVVYILEKLGPLWKTIVEKHATLEEKYLKKIESKQSVPYLLYY
jgi:hypothetical protein